MRPRTSLSLVVVTLFVATTVWAQSRFTSNRERRFFSARDGIGLEAPNGWAFSMHTGYPSVLVALVHPGGSRISIAVDHTKLASATAFADQNRAGLLAQGLTLERIAPGPHGGVRVDARSPRRNQVVRQLYVVREVPNVPGGHQAIVVSLAASADQLGSADAAFDWTLAHLALETPAPTEGRTDAGR